MEAGATAHVGCSGYVYDHWQGVFYPDELSRNRWFEHYASHFDTVEINNTFYKLPEADTFDAWRERAPLGFQYALKLSRYGTHMKRLKDPREWLGRFLERAERLGASLGPILVQLPPHWHADPDRLSRFLAIAPVRHRWAIEFRDESWLCDEICDILREHGAALCLHDLVDDHPRVVTADWVYLRFHGAGSEGDIPAATRTRRSPHWRSGSGSTSATVSTSSPISTTTSTDTPSTTPGIYAATSAPTTHSTSWALRSKDTAKRLVGR